MKRQSCFQVCTLIYYFCFLLQIAWELGGIPASFSPRVPNLFSLFTSPAPQLDWNTIAKDVERKINIFYIDFLILGRFMNFVSVMQKLAFLQRGGISLIGFLLPQELHRHLVLCHHLHFTLNAKCLKWTNICFNLIHLLAEMLKRWLTHYIKFSNL